MLCDSYAAESMGYRPEDIEYIRLAANLGVGSMDTASAKVISLNDKINGGKTGMEMCIRDSLPIMRENAERNLSADEIEQMEKDVIRCGGVKRTVEEIHRYAALAGEILDSLEDIPEARKIRRMLDKLEAI